MQSIHILGKNNASITIMLDALYEKFKKQIEMKKTHQKHDHDQKNDHDHEHK